MVRSTSKGWPSCEERRPLPWGWYDIEHDHCCTPDDPQKCQWAFRDVVQMDRIPVLDHQITHSIDSFITNSANSANSATALYTGHKTTVDTLECYKDSSANPFDDPRSSQLLRCSTAGLVALLVLSARLSLLTQHPGGVTAHTQQRSRYVAVLDSVIHGITNYTWTVSILFLCNSDDG